MNQVTKRIVAAILSLVMVLSVAVVPTKAADAQSTTAKSTVTVTVERLTIGQGFLVSPTRVEISEGDTVATVFEKVMALKGITYPSTEGSYGFYLNAINNADTGVLNIPAEISALPDVTLWDGSIAKAPTNDVNDGNLYENNGLGTASYNSMSGWMFTVNNQDPGLGADSVSVKDGDVIRWQFSVYGYGADIGFDTESYTDIPKVTLANKDSLMKEVAAVAGNAAMLKDAAVKNAYDNAIIILEKYNPTASEIATALTKLQTVEQAFTDKQEPTTAKKVTVGKTKVKSASKKRTSATMKISLKKVTGAKKYQVQISTSKKFKKVLVRKTVKKSTFTFKNKKLKNKKTLYVRARAVKVAAKKTYIGKWSAVKKVKIKK